MRTAVMNPEIRRPKAERRPKSEGRKDTLVNWRTSKANWFRGVRAAKLLRTPSCLDHLRISAFASSWVKRTQEGFNLPTTKFAEYAKKSRRGTGFSVFSVVRG